MVGAGLKDPGQASRDREVRSHRDGPDHHDFHHSRFRGNYAGYLPHMDTWLETLSRGYAAHREG